jgi:hypothetical protein
MAQVCPGCTLGSDKYRNWRALAGNPARRAF